MELAKNPQTGRYSARIPLTFGGSSIHVTMRHEDRITVGTAVLTSEECDELIDTIRAAQLLSAELGLARALGVAGDA